jgi:hypothetical protein
LSSGKVACTGRLGGKVLKGTAKFFSIQLNVGGQVLQSPSAVCSWKIPKTASKKTLNGSIAVTESGLTVSRSFTTKVR